MKTHSYSFDIRQKKRNNSELVGDQVGSIDNYLGVVENNGFLKTPPSNIHQNSVNKYIAKDICVEYKDNVSEPSVKVPTNSSMKYIIKDGFDYSFVDYNPLPILHIDPYGFLGLSQENFDTVVLKTYLSNIQAAIKTEEYLPLSPNKMFTTYSFNFGGISKASAYFFYVDLNNKINIVDREEIEVDYIEGIIYIEQGATENITQMYGIFSLEPVKIDCKGFVDLNKKESGLYKIINKPITKNHIHLKYINSTKVLLTSSEKLVILIPNNTEYTLKIDGVCLKPDQYFYMEVGDILCVELIPKTDELTSEYKSEDNSFTFLNINGITYNPTQSTVSFINDKEKTSNIYLTIFRETEEDSYNKDSPLLLRIF